MTMNSVRPKKVCIIGAGPLGLSTAFYLLQTKKHKVHLTILEASSGAGGLASTHMLENGENIESYYHHIFSSDQSFISLCKEIGLDSQLYFRKTSIGHYFNSKLYNFGGPLDILTGKLLSPLDRLRFIFASIYLKSGIEKIFPRETAFNGCSKLYGSQCTQRIWQPLLEGKYGNYKELVPMSWLAARIRDRSIKLGYIDGGFDVFYTKLAGICALKGVDIRYNTRVKSLKVGAGNIFVDDTSYDACLSTIGPVGEAKAGLSESIDIVKYLGAICVIYELQDNPNLPYWTNYCDPDSPVLAVISHRQLDDSPRFGACYPVYSAAYVLPDSKMHELSDSEIKRLFFEPVQATASAGKCPLKLDYTKATVYRAKYAQPLINPDIGLPPIIHLNGPLYRASMHSIYPNDRGQNYAISLGKRMAKAIIDDFENK